MKSKNKLERERGEERGRDTESEKERGGSGGYLMKLSISKIIQHSERNAT